ncbi:TlpA family protein disulfide reductase [Lutibacter sp.]
MKSFLLTLVLFFTLLQINAQSTLPQLSLKDTQGKSIDLSEIDTSTVTVFSFWATWCVPCINELDAINDEYIDWQDETDFKIIAVSIDDTRTSSRVAPLVNGKGWEYQVLLDTNQDFMRAVNATTVPFLIIVKNNKIVYSHSGYTPGSEIELLEKIKEFAN